jgi:hypothetical protein
MTTATPISKFGYAPGLCGHRAQVRTGVAAGEKLCEREGRVNTGVHAAQRNQARNGRAWKL